MTMANGHHGLIDHELEVSLGQMVFDFDQGVLVASGVDGAEDGGLGVEEGEANEAGHGMN